MSCGTAYAEQPVGPPPHYIHLRVPLPLLTWRAFNVRTREFVREDQLELGTVAARGARASAIGRVDIHPLTLRAEDARRARANLTRANLTIVEGERHEPEQQHTRRGSGSCATSVLGRLWLCETASGVVMSRLRERWSGAIGEIRAGERAHRHDLRRAPRSR